MQITCPECVKQFNVKDNLIPKDGRLLQCGSCNHKWFFENTIKLNENNNKLIKKKSSTITKTAPSKVYIEDDIEIKSDNNKIKSNNYKKNNLNLFKFFIFILILILSLVILIDTFKIQISHIYPEINNLMNSLYETLKDLKLFFLDLVK